MRRLLVGPFLGAFLDPFLGRRFVALRRLLRGRYAVEIRNSRRDIRLDRVLRAVRTREGRLTVAAAPEQYAATARSALGRRWRITRRDEPGGVITLSAEKGYSRETGNLLFHLALLTALILIAIGLTLVRLVVTKRRLLEWETAATTAAKATELVGRNGVGQFVIDMVSSPMIAVIVALTISARGGDALGVSAPFLLLWATAPVIAYWLSLPAGPRVRPLTESGRTLLRWRCARAAWQCPIRRPRHCSLRSTPTHTRCSRRSGQTSRSTWLASRTRDDDDHNVVGQGIECGLARGHGARSQGDPLGGGHRQAGGRLPGDRGTPG